VDKIPHNPKRRWNAIIERFPKNDKIIGAEVGVWMGKTSQKLLEHFPNLFLYMIDRWCVPPKGDSYYNGSTEMVRSSMKEWQSVHAKAVRVVSPYRGRYKIMKTTTLEAASHIKDKSLDFVFIDADHSYEGVTGDIKAWLPKVKAGGLLCGHDYENENTKGEVKRAVHELLGDKIELSYNKTWFYRVMS